MLEHSPDTAPRPAPAPIGAPDLREQFRTLADTLGSLVVGQDRAVEHLVIALLADGHVLLQGAPGLAKTRIARLLALALEGRYRRIQFTPDLLPSDLVGAAIYNAAEQQFEFRPGPIFARFVLADEINRAPAKVQSALLEAMEERQVTSGETTWPLEVPFLVVATQNPIEHDGTWDLPHAQLDRFLMQITLDYPGIETERDILDLAVTEAAEQLATEATAKPGVSISGARTRAAQAEAARVHLSTPVRDYIVRLVAATRGIPEQVPGVGEHLSHPASPRGTIMLARAAQARAWLAGRDHVRPDDVQALAHDVLRHRIGLTYRAETDAVAPDAIIDAVLGHVAVV